MGKTLFVKRGVVIQEINDYFIEFILALHRCASKFGHSYTITSANDGKHCKESYHYKNCAWDVRLKNLQPSHWYVLQHELKLQLPAYFDIIVENIADPDNVHLHCEADLGRIADFILTDHAEGAS